MYIVFSSLSLSLSASLPAVYTCPYTRCTDRGSSSDFPGVLAVEASTIANNCGITYLKYIATIVSYTLQPIVSYTTSIRNDIGSHLRPCIIFVCSGLRGSARAMDIAKLIHDQAIELKLL